MRVTVLVEEGMKRIDALGYKAERGVELEGFILYPSIRQA